MNNIDYKKLGDEVRSCTLCEPHLVSGPRPIFQIHPNSKILIAGQAPGRKAHATGIPFDDPSGDRLREWMGVNKDIFYDPEKVAILPMGFCYPGQGKSGDLPPRKECSEKWRDQLLSVIPNVKLTLIIGQYALNWHLQKNQKKNLTETVKAWKEYWPNNLPLPHPSPRNNIWLKKNPWFEKEVLPELKATVNINLHS